VNNHDVLRSAATRKERRTSLLLGAALILMGSAAEPLYRQFNGPLLALRVLWCAVLAIVALALPRASTRLYGFLLPLAGLSSSWLFTTTVWLNGGLDSPDFQYITLLPLFMMVLFQDEVIACMGTVAAALSGVAVLSWLGGAPISVIADSLATEASVGILAIFGSFSFRRVRIAELTTQQARAKVLEQLALSEHRRAQVERLASLGQLAAGVAHEINNPLYSVSANVEMLTGEPGLSGPGLTTSETQSMLADIQLGIARIGQIVKDLKEFSSGGGDKLQPCQVDDVVGDALRLASFRLGKAIEVRRSCEPDVPTITVNRRKLSQALLNLLVNSADALEEARTEKPWIVIAVGRMGSAVQISVQDNGPGISAEVAARLFEPFVTSKPIGKGTGLGLALSREYITSFGGKLELQSIVGAGTRFSILLPTTPAASRPASCGDPISAVPPVRSIT
jgi:signal transduction histidine kinase